MPPRHAVREAPLLRGHVDRVRGSDRQRCLRHIANNSDDGEPWSCVRTYVETLADRIHARKAPARERFIDDSGQGGSGYIVRVQHPAVSERDAHRFQVAGTHRISKPVVIFVGGRCRNGFEVDAPGAFVSGQRQLTGECGCRDPWHLAHRLEDLRKVSMCGIGIPEPLSGGLHLHCQQL